MFFFLGGGGLFCYELSESDPNSLVYGYMYYMKLYCLFLPGIYQVTMSHAKLGITKDLLATKVLPFLIPISIDSNLNLSQVNFLNLYLEFHLSL